MLESMKTGVEAARAMTYAAAGAGDSLERARRAFLFAGAACETVCQDAVQSLGGYGYMAEYEVERFYRDAKITELYEGTKEIQKNTIASALLGKLK